MSEHHEESSSGGSGSKKALGPPGRWTKEEHFSITGEDFQYSVTTEMANLDHQTSGAGQRSLEVARQKKRFTQPINL